MDAEALHQDGLRLLLGEGVDRDPARAAAALEQAAAAGSGQAAARLAVLAASGVGRAESWPDALDWLETAARLGDRLAQRQLAVLTGDPGIAARIEASATQEPEVWRAAREGIDVARWMGEDLEVKVASSEPRIAVLPHFLPPTVCRWLVERGEEAPKPAMILDFLTGAKRPDPGRTNLVTRLGVARIDLVVLMAQARIREVTGFDFARMEAPNLLRYDPGQEFKLHLDYMDPGFGQTKAEVAAYGQRVATFLVYLNDDFEGGETDFPKAAFRFRGEPGDGLLFYSLKPSGSPDPKSLHAGLPPTRGRKWLLSQWMRDKPQPID